MKHAKTPHQAHSHTDDRDISPTAQYDKPQATDLKHQATQNSSHTSNHFAKTQAAGFEIPNKDSRIFDEKSLLCEQAQGSYLGGNDRRACEAIKDLSQKAESKAKAPRLCGCVEFIYTGKEPYTLRLTSGESFSLKPKEHFIIPRDTLSRWCEYKTTLFKKFRI